jgi:hypothetical protein
LRILLDENLPHALRNYLPEHETVTAAYAGLAGLKNGELLDAVEHAGFDVLVTGDKTLEYEQNLRRRKIALVCLSANAWRIVKGHATEIADAVAAATPGSISHVNCGKFEEPRGERHRRRSEPT